MLLVIAFGCTVKREDIRKIQVGQTKDEVIAIAGDPDEIGEFILPAEPFFGPQEGLSSLLPAGTIVEEWRYKPADEVTYVWFAGEDALPRADWTVIDSAAYPADAVY